MKCQKCGADSSVLATRTHMEIFLKRSRECFNGHRFTSYEVFAANLDRRTLKQTINSATKIRKKSFAIKKAVLAPENATLRTGLLAKKLKISDSYVRDIRRQARFVMEASTNGSLPTAASLPGRAKTRAAGSGPGA
jgi:hypothetical protein